jgi:hypothetical protein
VRRSLLFDQGDRTFRSWSFITHPDLAHTQGVRQSGVTVALDVLEGERLIRAMRARIEGPHI